MMHSPLFGWLTVGCYVGLAVSRLAARDWKSGLIAATFAVSNWLIFCCKG